MKSKPPRFRYRDGDRNFETRKPRYRSQLQSSPKKNEPSPQMNQGRGYIHRSEHFQGKTPTHTHKAPENASKDPLRPFLKESSKENQFQPNPTKKTRATLFLLTAAISNLLLLFVVSFPEIANAAPKQLTKDPNFWAVFCGFLFLFFAAVEFIHKWNLIPSGTDKMVKKLDQTRKLLAPDDFDFKKTPLGIALESVENTEETLKEVKVSVQGLHKEINVLKSEQSKAQKKTDQIHSLFFDENSKLVLMKILHESHQEIHRIFEKLHESDSKNATSMIKVTNLLTLQNRRLRHLLQMSLNEQIQTSQNELVTKTHVNKQALPDFLIDPYEEDEADE